MSDVLEIKTVDNILKFLTLIKYLTQLKATHLNSTYFPFLKPLNTGNSQAVLQVLVARSLPNGSWVEFVIGIDLRLGLKN